MKTEKFKLGDKVRVVNPSICSKNNVGDIGYIVAIEDVELEDIGKCRIYQIHKDINFVGVTRTWEGESGIVLASELTYDELLKQRDELLGALKRAQSLIDHVINITPTGEQRNLYTHANIVALTAINNATLNKQ